MLSPSRYRHERLLSGGPGALLAVDAGCAASNWGARTVGVAAMHPTVFNAPLDEVLNLIGIFVFAVSGALLAVRKNYDIVGMTVLAEITAIGGGVVRDLILGAVPPAAFTDRLSFVVPLIATALTFFTHTWMNRLQAAVLVFDAAGLALFCVSGAAKALAYGIGPVEAVALGAISAVGGGVMRDVLANDQPAVLRADSELYAVPAVLGSTIVVVVTMLHHYGTLSASLAVVFVFALRIIALRYGWQAPRPRRAKGTGGTGAAPDFTERS
jgi:uncharacterized membrane protein YeiH